MIGAADRYSRVAVVLHWLMAIAIIAMLVMGLLMTDDDILPMPLKFQMYQWHKSLGVILLWLIAVRLAWRLTHRAPELGAKFAKWERVMALLGHLGLYVLMIAMPLTGWLVVSSSATGIPTIVFGLLQWPHFPGVNGESTMLHEVVEFLHTSLAYVLIAMIALHVLAVVKHAVIDRENILPRMWFAVGKQPRQTPEKIDA